MTTYTYVKAAMVDFWQASLQSGGNITGASPQLPLHSILQSPGKTSILAVFAVLSPIATIDVV
jgi:hypothetical protein